VRILIVDDERPARAELAYMLAQIEATATLVEARNGNEALEILSAEAFDVVFLDINMPGASGLTVAAAIAEMPTVQRPLIVFATAYDVHAVRAFELAALDYIVKPFQEARLAQTMQRIRHALADQPDREQNASALRHYLAQNAPPLLRLWAERANKNAVLVSYDAIMWAEAEQKQVYIVTSDGAKLLVRHTIKELEARLAASGFVRAHKAYVVNLAYVAEVVPWFSGTYQLRMRDAVATEIPMSRQYGRELKSLLN
jgi:DNA-binding LytR/AlgR family response regulator